MKLRCVLGHDWVYFSGDRFDDRGQRCSRCPKVIVTRHADPRPAHIAADPSRPSTAMERAAAAAASRPGILIGSAHAPRSVSGGRITESERLAMQASARAALRRLEAAEPT